MPQSLPLLKKRKLNTQPQDEGIVALEARLTASLKQDGNLNPLADLQKLLRKSTDGAVVHQTVYALYRCFVSITDAGRLTGSNDSEERKAVKTWLWSIYWEYVDYLCSILHDEEKMLRESALQVLMSLLNHLSSAFSISTGNPQMHIMQFRRIVHALLMKPASQRGKTDPSTLDNCVQEQFLDRWLTVNDDVRWFFFREATTMLKDGSTYLTQCKALPENVLWYLERLTTMPTEKTELNSFWIAELKKKPSKHIQNGVEVQEEVSADDVDDWRKFFDEPKPSTSQTQSRGPRLYKLTTHEALHSLEAHRAQLTACWLQLLPHLSTSTRLSSRALAVLHRNAMPHITRPLRLMDWISNCVDFGGAVGLLALNALFVLMRDYNLDYPEFYTRLYAFLDRDMLHLKYRSRFFRLADTFLSSTHLPAALLASFIKRLSRLSLSASPSAIIIILPFTYNILKRHPACMVMIHRNVDSANFEDPFKPEEPVPTKTDALQSSLWELYSHRDHYHSSVSTLARIFAEVFTKQSYAMEDFLDHTYSTLLETEINRKIKKEPAAVLRIPDSPFLSVEGPERTEDDVITQLWTF